MSLALALWLVLAVAIIAHGHGRRRGRLQMAALVEARYGPLFEQLEQFVDSIDSFAANLSSEAQQQINTQIEAMRKASRVN